MIAFSTMRGTIRGEKVDEAMRASADAKAAMIAGDTQKSAAEFEKAGESLLEHLHSQSQLIRFLAASNFYNGGDYLRAHGLCKKIEEDMLPEEVRLLFSQFKKDASIRASPTYHQEMRDEIQRLWNVGEYKKIIDTLSEHPFIYSQARLAEVRAMCCERLKDYSAAEIFRADALRYASQGERSGCPPADFIKPVEYPWNEEDFKVDLAIKSFSDNTYADEHGQ